MKFLSNHWFLLGLRIIIGGIFLYAGITKVLDPLAFADSIASFQILPPTLINLVALALPPFEVLLGAQLIVGWRPRAGFLAAFALSLVFVLALGQGIGRGLEIDCGCFGSGEPSVRSSWFSFARAFLLMLASGWALSREILKGRTKSE